MVKIKNISGAELSLHLYTFAIDDLYTIPEDERQSWANNDDTIDAIVNESIQIYDGDAAIEGHARQINTLKGGLVSAEITNEPTFKYTSRYSMKGCGVRKSDCPKNDISFIDLKIENKVNSKGIAETEDYLYKYLKGGQVLAEGGGFYRGDWAEFWIIDKDARLVEIGEMDQATWDYLKGSNDCVYVKNFLPDWFIHPLNDKCNLIDAESPGKVLVGLYARCILHTIDDGGNRDMIINYNIQNLD